jgi:hypothetical protein
MKTRDARTATPLRTITSEAGGKIPEAERDRNLFRAGTWPKGAVAKLDGSWRVSRGHLFRRLHVYNEDERPGAGTPSKLWEALLRFPNAPLYGTHVQRTPPFVFREEESWPNFHTMRVLGRGTRSLRRVKHVYLLHNGLNETEDLTFHYRLAAWILAHRRDAVCILRPLPGHLTRFAFHGPYAEQPLDVYLRDPADLFRQFLRHMLETQWLLSALVPRPHYAVMGGTRLLAEVSGRHSRPRGRANTDDLAQAMSDEWDAAFRAAQEAARRGTTGQIVHHKVPPTLQELRASIAELRTLLRWDPVITTTRPRTGKRRGVPVEPELPTIHVVGYSMGGFMAQAAFFAWPFAIASCTNMFAGGPLRDLAPTAFAHPEEWQAVLHGMRYELDIAFRRTLKLDDAEEAESAKPPENGKPPEPEAAASRAEELRRIAGICTDDFAYFTRVFYEVYLQYYRGGYESRVAEFSRRLLFVVGGDDPIVRTKNVLDAGPPKGMTLLQLADVSHFPSSRGRGPDGGKAEEEQRKYWLPEVGRMIANFSRNGERLLQDTLAVSWGTATGAELPPESRDDTPKNDREPVLLDSLEFARELRSLVRRIEPTGQARRPGWLLISRNEIPPVFMGQHGFCFHGQTVHHSEQQIFEYVRTLEERARYLRRRVDRTTLLIPARGDRWFWNTKFFSMSETPNAARIPTEAERHDMIDRFQEWVDLGMVWEVAADEYEIPADDMGRTAVPPLRAALAAELETERLSLTILPDVWIGLSPTALKSMRGDQLSHRRQTEEGIVGWATARVLARLEGRNDERTEQLNDLQNWIDSGDVLAITVSAAELNPRYRGRRLRKAWQVENAIIHWALAFEASTVAESAPPLETEKDSRADAGREDKPAAGPDALERVPATA